MRKFAYGSNQSRGLSVFVCPAAANALFYGLVFAAILFFWNWFGISKAAKDFTAVSADVRSVVWTIFDALLPVLNGAMGIHLLRPQRNQSSV